MGGGGCWRNAHERFLASDGYRASHVITLYPVNTVASFYKHAPGPAPVCLWSVYACKESGFEPYKSGRDQGRYACRGVMLIHSMLIKRVDCSELLRVTPHAIHPYQPAFDCASNMEAVMDNCFRYLQRYRRL